MRGTLQSHQADIFVSFPGLAVAWHEQLRVSFLWSHSVAFLTARKGDMCSVVTNTGPFKPMDSEPDDTALSLSWQLAGSTS